MPRQSRFLPRRRAISSRCWTFPMWCLRCTPRWMAAPIRSASPCRWPLGRASGGVIIKEHPPVLQINRGDGRATAERGTFMPTRSSCVPACGLFNWQRSGRRSPFAGRRALLAALRITGRCRLGEVPIHNKFVERQITQYALGRKLWMFCYDKVGAQASANLFSLVMTARANGMNRRQLSLACRDSYSRIDGTP